MLNELFIKGKFTKIFLQHKSLHIYFMLNKVSLWHLTNFMWHFIRYSTYIL